MRLGSLQNIRIPQRRLPCTAGRARVSTCVIYAAHAIGPYASSPARMYLVTKIFQERDSISLFACLVP